MGYCPNCSARLEEGVAKCWNCPANFGEGSAWIPLEKPFGKFKERIPTGSHARSLVTPKPLIVGIKVLACYWVASMIAFIPFLEEPGHGPSIGALYFMSPVLAPLFVGHLVSTVIYSPFSSLPISKESYWMLCVFMIALSVSLTFAFRAVNKSKC